MNINDARFSSLGAQGFTGSIDDRILQWLKANGATSNNIDDAWRQMLKAQGATSSNVNDALFEVLGGLGYTGNINEREAAFWSDGGAFGPEPLTQVDVLMTSSTKPYLIGFDTSQSPWAIGAPFGIEIEGPANNVVVNTAKTHFAVCFNSAPYLRLFTVAGVEIILGGGSDFADPITIVQFDSSNNLIVPRLNGFDSYNTTTGAAQGVKYNAGTGSGVNSLTMFNAKPDGSLFQYKADFSLDRGTCRYFDDAGADVSRNGTVIAPRYGKSAPYSNAFEVPRLTDLFNSRDYYSVAQNRYFDVTASELIQGLTAPTRTAIADIAGTRGVMIGDNTVYFATLAQSYGYRWTQRSVPASWPTDYSVVKDAVFSGDSSTLLFSNGQHFDITSNPPVEIDGAANAPSDATSVVFIN